jgi:sensor histidine kinase YesM
MLLIPFVENAFKHGVGYQGHPRIDIQLTIDRGWLIFEVQNNFEDEPGASKDDSSGIGLGNVRSRLNLLYKDRYTLRINDRNNLFHIVLTLKLI